MNVLNIMVQDLYVTAINISYKFSLELLGLSIFYTVLYKNISIQHKRDICEAF